MDQHFLNNPEKIRSMLDAASILPHESVLELGAGQGSVAKYILRCKSISLLELDKNLVKTLRREIPHAKVLHADATELLPLLEFEVLFSNLPFYLTDSVIGILAKKRFRCAVMSVKADHNLDTHRKKFRIDEVAVLNEEDFTPAQDYKSRLVRLTP